jgi:GntR family transcriptional regulator, transcriptional repressor for pyruvate dehydrogenase complex
MAGYAATHASEEQIDALRKNVDETKASHRQGLDLSDLDEQFHTLLGLASNHKAMLIAMEPYKALFLPVVDGIVHRNDVGGRLCVAHERIVEAIERRDTDVAQLWSRRHLLDFERGCEMAGVNIDVPFEPEVLENMR